MVYYWYAPFDYILQRKAILYSQHALDGRFHYVGPPLPDEGVEKIDSQ